jgi:hypothetical protein
MAAFKGYQPVKISLFEIEGNFIHRFYGRNFKSIIIAPPARRYID